MLYLVKGEVSVRRYLDDYANSSEEIRIVEADNEMEAKTRFEGYFESQTCEYDVYYRVYSADAFQAIMK